LLLCSCFGWLWGKKAKWCVVLIFAFYFEKEMRWELLFGKSKEQ
jgi:hypothetical protein